MTTARRVFLYLVTLVGLGLFVAGGILLIGLILDLAVRGGGAVGGSVSSQQFSLAIAMLLIGGGLWFPFWNIIQKRVAGNSAEIGAGFRKLYLNLIQTVTAFMALGAGIFSLNWLLGGPSAFDFPSYQLATLIMSSAVWFYHWRISEAEGHPAPAARTLRRWYIYILSGWGLITLSVNVIQLISNALSLLPFWQLTIIHGSSWQAVYPQLSSALFGGLAWWFFWFRMARGDAGSILRQVYFYLLAISGSAIAGLTALTVTVYKILAYMFGARDAAPYFQFLTWTVPTILVTLAIWMYHQRLAQEEAAGSPEKHLSARRVHLYLMSFISLGAMVSGLLMVLGVLLDLIFTALGSDIIAGTPGWWRAQLSTSLALLLVGVPMWLYYWGRVLRLVEQDAAERRTRSRRVFLYIILGVAIIALAAGLVNLIYRILTALFQGGSPDVLRDIKWGLQVVLVALPILLYFWQVIKQDQKAGAEAVAAPAPKQVTVIANGDPSGLAARLGARLGYPVKSLRYAGPPAPPVELDDLSVENTASLIEQAAGPKVMLVILNNEISILPYQD
jgi:hypothetical protein